MIFETWQQIFLGILVLLVFASFVKQWLPTELTALLAWFLCFATGVLSWDSNADNYGFGILSHPAPLILICLFVISTALEKTGIIDWLGHYFEKLSGDSPWKMLLAMMLMVMLPSAMINNTAVVIVFMPVVMSLCRKKNYFPSQFLIPLSYIAITGGTITIVGTSTNLIAAKIAEEAGQEVFSLFEITPLGLIFTATTMVYLLLFGRKLLPNRDTVSSLIDVEQTRSFISHVVITEESHLEGEPIKEALAKYFSNINLLEIIRDKKALKYKESELVFKVGDELIVKGELAGLREVAKQTSSDADEIEEVEAKDLSLLDIKTESVVLMEAILGPDSRFLGQSLKEANFRSQYGVSVIAVHRKGFNLSMKFNEVKLRFGDTLLLQGNRPALSRLFQQNNFINLSEPKETPLRKSHAPIVLFALACFIGISVLCQYNVLPNIPILILALGAALLCLVSGALKPKEAYGSIEWKVIFLILGMLGLGQAIEFSGLASNLAEGIVGLLGSHHPGIVLAAFYLFAAILTEIISNNAVAALLTPLAIIVADQIGVDARPFVIAVMFGASASFSTPIGYQTNTFVFGAGGYQFKDFFKVGFPLAVILWIVASFLIPVFWPF